MQHLKDIRTSLEVGFAEGGVPDEFLCFRGRQTRAIEAMAEFPYEDMQFDTVLMDGGMVSAKLVKEAHRVLKPEGRLYFKVREKTKSQDGFTLPKIYSIVRDGFNIVEVVRPAWWLFGLGGRTITICAMKKTWRSRANVYRPYV